MSDKRDDRLHTGNARDDRQRRFNGCALAWVSEKRRPRAVLESHTHRCKVLFNHLRRRLPHLVTARHPAVRENFAAERDRCPQGDLIRKGGVAAAPDMLPADLVRAAPRSHDRGLSRSPVTSAHPALRSLALQGMMHHPNTSQVLGRRFEVRIVAPYGALPTSPVLAEPEPVVGPVVGPLGPASAPEAVAPAGNTPRGAPREPRRQPAPHYAAACGGPLSRKR